MQLYHSLQAPNAGSFKQGKDGAAVVKTAVRTENGWQRTGLGTGREVARTTGSRRNGTGKEVGGQ